MADRPIPARARMLQLHGQVLVLREVHAGRVRTRTDLSGRYGMSRGSASELTTRLRVAALLDERPVDPTGRRGRPTSVLGAHPGGPLVCAVDIGHEHWAVALVQLGGAVVQRLGGRLLDHDPPTVFKPAAEAVAALTEQYPGRITAISVAVSGTVHGTRVVQASTLGWRDVDVPPFFAAFGRPVLVGNDATLAGLAEARRGVAAGVAVSLHISLEVGIGGVLVVDGRPQTGATGAGGEYGHLPFGDPDLPCPCGASGCWDMAVDGRALARVLGRAEPDDPRQFANAIVAEARTGDPTALAALDHLATALGRGTGALVNALDPELVALFGLGPDLLELCGPALTSAYHRALMAFRRKSPPPLLASAVPGPASLIGAAELGFDRLLTEAGLDEWCRRR